MTLQVEQGHYEIFIRNRNFDTDGVVTRYSRLEFRQVYNGVGSWMLEMESNTPAALRMKQIFSEEAGANGGIIVTRNGQIVFSGITRAFEQTGEYMDQDDQENITFFGCCDNGLLSMRLVMPPRRGSNPEEFIAPSNQNWDVWRYPDVNNEEQQGYRVSDVIYTTVADNISFRAPLFPNQNPQIQERNIRELYIKKPDKMGPRCVIRGRYQNLLSKIQELSYFPGNDPYQRLRPNYTGLQFKTMQLREPILVYSSGPPENPDTIINTPVNPNNVLPYDKQLKKVQFEIVQPEDKTNTIVFSKGFKNLGTFRYKLSAPQSTFVVLGGQNNTSAIVPFPDSNPRTRWFAHAGANSPNSKNLLSQYGLWETFLDRRDIQYGDGTVEEPYPVRNAAGKAGQYYRDMQREFVQAMQTELIEKRDLLEVEVTGINVEHTVWSVDYNVGDMVTVVIPGEERNPIKAKVKEVTVTLTKENGEEVKAMIGTETQPNGRDLFSNLVRVNKKTNFLEELR